MPYMYKTPWRKKFFIHWHNTAVNFEIPLKVSCWLQLYRAISRLFHHSIYTEVSSLRWALVKMKKCRTGTKNPSGFWAQASWFWDLLITSLLCWGTRAYAVVFEVSLHQQLLSPFTNPNSIWKGSRKANTVLGTNRSRADQTSVSRGKQRSPPSPFSYWESSAPASRRLSLLTSQLASVPEGQQQPGCLRPIGRAQGVKRGAAAEGKGKDHKLRGNQTVGTSPTEQLAL